MPAAHAFECPALGIQLVPVHHDHAHVTCRARQVADRWVLLNHAIPSCVRGGRSALLSPVMARGPTMAKTKSDNRGLSPWQNDQSKPSPSGFRNAPSNISRPIDFTTLILAGRKSLGRSSPKT